MFWSPDIQIYTPSTHYIELKAYEQSAIFDPFYFFEPLPNPLVLCGSANLQNEDLFFLPYARSVKTIKIIGCDKLTDEALQFLPSSIEELVIEDCPGFTDKGIAALSFLPGLQKLTLISCPGIEGRAFGYLPPYLRSLTLEKCVSVKDIALAALYFLPRLQELFLVECEYVTGIGFEFLPLSIKTLSVQGAPYLNDQSIQGLVALKKLETLTLSTCLNLLGSGFEALPKGLKSLSVKGCENYYNIGTLAPLKNLSFLDVTNTKVTDLDLPFLEALSIDEIVIGNCEN